jgi:carbohydrate-selective porin OprB
MRLLFIVARCERDHACQDLASPVWLPAIFLLASDAPAADAPDWNADTLTGDWGGARTNLSERGVTLEVAQGGRPVERRRHKTRHKIHG